MENLMILPAVEPKESVGSMSTQQTRKLLQTFRKERKRHFRLSKQTQRLSNCRTSKTSALFLCSARTMN